MTAPPCTTCGHGLFDHSYQFRLCAAEILDSGTLPMTRPCEKGCMQYTTTEEA